MCVDGRIGISDGTRRVAGIVEAKQVDRQRAGREFEAAPHLGAGEAETLESDAGRLVQIGEADTPRSRLGHAWADAGAAKQSSQQRPAR